MNKPGSWMRGWSAAQGVSQGGWSVTLLLTGLAFAGLAASAGAQTTAVPPAAGTSSAMATTATSLPLFYKSLVPFDMNQHRELTVPKVQNNYAFAANTDIVPLMVTEVAQAVRFFPMVFIKDRATSAVSMVALVGKGDGKNQFVDANGQWRSGVYIPAWLRRYPFALFSGPKGEGVLALDTQAKVFEDKRDPQRLIDTQGKPTEQLQRIFEFQKEFLAQSRLTTTTTQLLLEAGVLEDARFLIKGPTSDKPQNIQGFMVVNEQKLKALKAEQLEKLHRADALGLAYAQLLSMGHVANILNAQGR
jgi:hypothetical protein